MATSPRAIPVRIVTKTLRQMCLESDPEFMEESENPEVYRFGKRVFRERYRTRGPYEES